MLFQSITSDFDMSGKTFLPSIFYMVIMSWGCMQLVITGTSKLDYFSTAIKLIFFMACRLQFIDTSLKSFFFGWISF
jgi:hypothetical protein